jgi:hypothetical protein
MATRHDPEYQKAKNRRFYERNRERAKKEAIENTLARKNKHRKLIKRYKLLIGCSRCGYKNYDKALEFHHLGEVEKVDSVSAMLRENVSTKRLKAEIRKCIVVCANCHREIHRDVDV